MKDCHLSFAHFARKNCKRRQDKSGQMLMI